MCGQRSIGASGLESGSFLNLQYGHSDEHLQSLYQTRYGNPHAQPAAVSTPTIELLLQHRSVRAYAKDRAVSEDQLEAMIAAAQSAASSSNLQAWSVVAVRDEARKARLAELAGKQRHIVDAPLQLVWLADLARLEHVAKSVDRPFAALDHTEMLMVGVIDASLAAQNAAIAAESMGLSMVYIGGMRNKPEEVAEVLGLPPRVVAVFGMCIGYEDDSKPASIKPRPPQPVVLHRETTSSPPRKRASQPITRRWRASTRSRA